MTDIRVNPQDVIAYGTAAQDKFTNIITELNNLCNDCVAVPYYGANSVAFKNGAGDLAETFANGLRADMGNVATAIKNSTSNISGSLGGTAISIEVSGQPITAPPAPADTGESGANTEALLNLVTQVGTRFTQVTTLLDEHLTRLVSTDWTGKAKDNTVTAVSTFTTGAKAKATAAQDGLVKFIQQQHEAVVAADV